MQKVLLTARRIYREGNNTEWILLAIEDITKRRTVEDAFLPGVTGLNWNIVEKALREERC